MSSLNTSFSQNNSIVHPEYFFVTGLSGIEYSNYYYIFIFVVYFIAVIGNSLVLLLKALDRSLHSPKYIGVFNLALADIGETNALIPNMMKTFLFGSQYISYNDYMANMFFVYLFLTMQRVILVVLAFDRFIAICLPLRYHAIVNYNATSVLFLVIWIFNASVVAVLVCLITRLSFCKSNNIPSFFCDYGPVYRLACNDNTINIFMISVFTVLYIWAPLVLIVLSYIGIFLTAIKITTWEGRLKALKTCVSHLLLVGSFFLPILCVYIATSTSSLTPNARIIGTSLSYIIPPMLNPIIYVLNTAEIKDIIRKILKNSSVSIRNKISNI